MMLEQLKQYWSAKPILKNPYGKFYFPGQAYLKIEGLNLRDALNKVLKFMKLYGDNNKLLSLPWVIIEYI